MKELIEKLNTKKLKEQGSDTLGTKWKWMKMMRGDEVIYGIDADGKTYRIAVDMIDPSKWRIDSYDVAMWVAVNDKQYASPQKAAKDLVGIHEKWIAKQRNKRLSAQLLALGR